MSNTIPNTTAQSAINAATASAAVGAANAGGRTSQSLKTLSDNFGSFLRLLTVQLQNQDPLSPMETHEFTSQLVMFAGAEQAISTNQKLDTLIGIGQKNEASQALNYYGKQVRVKGNKLSFQGEPVTFQYTAPAEVASAELTVRDSAGKVVFTKPLETSQFQQGEHNLTWDGRNQYGYQLAKGLYTVVVSGKDSAGSLVNTSDMTVTAAVKGVEHKNGKTWLNMGYYQVTLDDVASITMPGLNVEDQVRAMNFVGNNVLIIGSTAQVKNGRLSLAYNTAGIANFGKALGSEILKAVKLKFYNQSGSLVKTQDITAKMDMAKLTGGEKRIDMTIPDLINNNYRVEMQVDFAGSGSVTGSTFNKIPMGYSGKVRRVVFNNGEIRLEINGVLYNPSDVGSVISSETPVFKLSS
ncbi:MAG: flagellar hook assembly protein FlgD [Alphaproteobacteria bacterium]|nr:flagellar hook assembly protein FlgD [Alphaproteobacteria bacterium]